MITYTTPDRHGYSIRFSPYNANQMLLATSQLYGLAGGGSLFLLERADEADDGLKQLSRIEWTDGLFDVAWSPSAENVAATASGDGSLQIWRELNVATVADKQTAVTPVACLKEHQNEVYSLCWGEKWNYHTLLSASWDKTIKLWDTNRNKSLATFAGHSDLVYCARFSPLIANVFASVGTDGCINLWHCFDFSGKPMMSVEAAHAGEVLCCDWSQYERNVLLTGGSDGFVRAWDLRNMRQHVFQLYSGDFAVRRVACSPDVSTVLATANYDFTTRIWDYAQSLEASEVRAHHTEFVCGLDWNPNRSYELADCGWDAVVNIYTPKCMLANLE